MGRLHFTPSANLHPFPCRFFLSAWVDFVKRQRWYSIDGKLGKQNLLTGIVKQGMVRLIEGRGRQLRSYSDSRQRELSGWQKGCWLGK